MIHKAHVEALDRTLRDIKNSNKIMGGITVIFTGNFRESLPVVVSGTRDLLKNFPDMEVCLCSKTIH